MAFSDTQGGGGSCRDSAPGQASRNLFSQTPLRFVLPNSGTTDEFKQLSGNFKELIIVVSIVHHMIGVNAIGGNQRDLTRSSE